MGKPNRPNFHMLKLGRALQALRTRARLTQEEAGERLRFSNKKMSRVENGQLPGYHELVAMLDLYGLTVAEWDPFVALWERSQEQGWWRAYGKSDQGYVPLEHEASEVREFQLSFVPGLLQTESYMQAAFAASRVASSQKWIDNEIAVRLKRQERLTEEPFLRLFEIIDETVLRRAVPAGIMRVQLHHILKCTELPNVTVQVLAHPTGLSDGLLGTFTVLSFPEVDESDIAYTEHALGAAHVNDEDAVAAVKLRFRHLSKLALSPSDSQTFIERVASEL